MKRLNIYSDGYGTGTVVIDEDGNKIEGVVEAIIRIEPQDVVRVELTIMAPKLNIASAVPETVWLICPVCEEQHSHECQPNTLGGP